MGNPLLLYLLILFILPVLTRSSNPVSRWVTAQEEDSHLGYDIECDESPPSCDVLQQRFDEFPYIFTMPDHGYVNQIVHVLFINSSRSVCTLDPFQQVTDLGNGSVPLQLYFSIACVNSSTRIVMRPSRNLTNPLTFGYVLVKDCITYWKDLSRMGQYLDVRVLMLHSWTDEFDQQEPGYFHECVGLDPTSNAGPETKTEPSVSGLANVGTLDLYSSIIRPISVAFTQNLWPLMAEVSFQGYHLEVSDVDALVRTMPVLQTFEYYGLSQLTLPSLAFPWCHEALYLPLNLSRTASFNNQYSEALGTKILQPNLYRLMLLLDGVALPFLLNTTFLGHMNKIQLTYCNITFVSRSMFAGVQHLQALDLSGNLIEHLEQDVFVGLEQLVTIKLENNLLTYLPVRLFHGLDRLTHVLLSGNHLESIAPLTFSGLYCLKHIDLSNNRLLNVSDEAMGRQSSDFTQFTQIDLSDNQMTDFPIWLLEMRFLTDIDLSRNPITFKGIKETLSRISTGEYIRYGNAHSSSISGNVYLPAFRKTIKLHDTKITDFNITEFDMAEFVNFQLLMNFFEFDVGENGVHCNCRVYAMYNYFQSFGRDSLRDYNEIGVLPFNMNQITCQYPRQFKGVPLVDIPNTAFGCIQKVDSCPQHCQCWVRSLDSAVKVNCRNQNLTHLPETLPFLTIELDFSENLAIGLDPVPHFLHHSNSIKLFDISNNQISFLSGDLFSTRSSVTDLRLHGNKISTLPTEVKNMRWNVTMTLSGNRFACDCTTLWLKQWLVKRRHQIQDIDEIMCSSGVPQGQAVLEVHDADFICLMDRLPIIVAVSIVAAILFLFMLLILVMYKYRGEVKIILYMKFGWHPFDRTDDTDILGKEFDAFVSYSHEDCQWVCEELRPRLEESHSFKLCIHDRDFVVGAAVSDNITSAVRISRRTVLVLSKAFLRSHWCHLEFKQAHYKALKDRTNYLIIVLCEDVSAEDLDDAMRLYMRTNTYLSRDNQWFWQKLRYAMPLKPLGLLQERFNLPVNYHSGLEALAHDQNAGNASINLHSIHHNNGHSGHCCQYRTPGEAGGPVDKGSGFDAVIEDHSADMTVQEAGHLTNFPHAQTEDC